MNSATFIGNLVSPAAKKGNTERPFITFTIAVNMKYKDKEEEVLFIECIKNGDNNNLLPYLDKGTKVCVQGRVNCHAYMANNGQPRANLDLAVFELELLCSPQRYQQAQTTQQQQVQAPQQVQQVPLQQALNQQVANDLPF
jgi:single-stranded DNA-binding protein